MDVQDFELAFLVVQLHFKVKKIQKSIYIFESPKSHLTL